MGLPNKDNNKRNYIGYLPVIISTFALIISVLTSYYIILKPFDLAIHIEPVVQVQYKGNLGLYLKVDFYNKSPRNGLITQLGLILYKATSIENKYLLTLESFRIVKESGIFTISEEWLPIFLQPWQRDSKITNFLYMADEQFPVSSGTYICELLVWTDYEKKAKYVEEFKFEITADVLKTYLDRRETGSTTLSPIPIVGYTPLESKKLTNEDYKQLY